MVGRFRLAQHQLPFEVICDSNFPSYNFNIVLGTTLHFNSNDCILICNHNPLQKSQRSSFHIQPAYSPLDPNHIPSETQPKNTSAYSLRLYSFSSVVLLFLGHTNVSMLQQSVNTGLFTYLMVDCLTPCFSGWCLGGVTFALQLPGQLLHLVSKKHAVGQKMLRYGKTLILNQWVVLS